MHPPLRSRSARILAASVTVAVATAMPAAALAQDDVTPGGTLVVAGPTQSRSTSIRPWSPPTACSSSPARSSSRWQRWTAGGTLRPLLATSWQGSEDGSTFTVNLREDVTWHDGEPFTSADVAFSAMEVWKAHGQPRTIVLRQSRVGGHAGRPHRGLQLLAAHALAAVRDRDAGADGGGPGAHPRGHRARQPRRPQPVQPGSGRAPVPSSSPSTAPASSTG